MKHSSDDTAELLDKLEKMQFELEDMNEVPEKISKLTKELKKIEIILDEKAEALRKTRLEGAPELEKKISGYLKKFGMEGVDLKVNVEKTDLAGQNGIDDVKFSINTTGSQKHSDISTLSGGELSRFLLSVKLVDREKGRLLLFDEIDSSIGGETARDASMEMKKNSKFNQIVVVTHFPQTAASADEHLVVEKKIIGGKVSANVRKLNKNEKIRELARMMGDSNSGRFNDTASEMVKED
jgi:DNA repair protein RecN (Recombination protein N)